MTNWCDRQEILDNIIADLRGTCQDIDEVATYWGAGELSIEDLQYIETEVFLCEGCGWWYSTWEMHDDTGENLCSSCSEPIDYYGEEDDE